MRFIPFETIKAKIKEACIEANYILGEDVLAGFRRARDQEDSPIGREILDQLIENARIAREQKIPLCQDTALAVHILMGPSHIASLPVAVNINCHFHRHREIIF